MNREGQFEVEIKPRDTYRHSVVVRQPGDTVSWTFATKRKNINFGLYYQLTADEAGFVVDESGPHKRRTLGRSLSADSVKLVKAGGSELLSRTPMDAHLSTDHVIEILRLAHPLVHISPPPKAGLPSSVFHANPSNQSTESLDTNEQQHTSPPERHTDADLIPIVPVEKYASAEATVSGSLDAPIAGTYVLMFDNTFSVHTAKQLTLCVSVRRHGLVDPNVVTPFATSMANPVNDNNNTSSIVHGGWLLKRKRLRMQGFAKRWFKLDSTGLLTYHDDPEGPVKGGLNVRMCVITKVPPRLLMTLDSGTELFHLKALTDTDYNQWSDRIAHVIHSLSQAAAAAGAAAAGIDESTLSSVGTTYGTDRDPTTTRSDALLLHQRILEHRISCTTAMEELKAAGKDDEDAVIGKHLVRLERTFAALNMFYNDVMLLERLLLTSTASMAMPSPQVLTSTTTTTTMGDLQKMTQSVKLEEDVFYDVIIMDDVSGAEDDDDYGEEEGEGRFGRDDSFTEHMTVQASSVTPSVEEQLSDTADQVKQQLAGGAHVVRLALPSKAKPINVTRMSLMGRMSGRNATTPVILNEPLSLLQRQCEELEYVDLLQAACRATSTLDRLANVTAFAVSCYASCLYRYAYKPFTPMLGETFEWFDVVRNFRFVAEKVEHRPDTILACYAESLDGKWKFWQELQVRSKTYVKSAELTPGGFTHVQILDNSNGGGGEVCEYRWNKVTSCVRNILTDQCFIDNYGEMVVQAVSPQEQGWYAKVDFAQSSTDGLFSASRTGRNELSGWIVDKRRRQVARLSGRWDDYVAVDDTVLWKAVPPPANSADYYGFSLFAMQLNVPPVTTDPSREPHPPPTDSRYRPDQRLVEEGDIATADLEKARVEQKQRAKRADMEASGTEHQPVWFCKHGDDHGEYRFGGRYFEEREALFCGRHFADIF